MIIKPDEKVRRMNGKGDDFLLIYSCSHIYPSFCGTWRP